MLKQDTLKPVDLAVVLTLAIKPADPSPTYEQLGQALGMSSSTSFESVHRLQSAGLLRPESREPNRAVLMNFLEYGVRCAFPPSIGKEARGVPTAHSGPALRAFFDSAKPYVWPDLDGTVRGTGLAPLYSNAPDLAKREPEIYSMLTLVDALRVGEARERKLALDALRKRLGVAK
jgi:hypothetical protein